MDEGSNLAELESEARGAIAASSTLQALTEVRARFLGRKGSISALLRSIGGLEPAERSRVGQAVNEAKVRVEAWVDERRALLETAADLQVPLTSPRLQVHRDLSGRTLISASWEEIVSIGGWKLGEWVDTLHYDYEVREGYGTP